MNCCCIIIHHFALLQSLTYLDGLYAIQCSHSCYFYIRPTSVLNTTEPFMPLKFHIYQKKNRSCKEFVNLEHNFLYKVPCSAVEMRLRASLTRLSPARVRTFVHTWVFLINIYITWRHAKWSKVTRSGLTLQEVV